MSASPRGSITGVVAARRRVRWGDTVRVHYMAWLEDGTVIGTSTYGQPIVFTAGRGRVLEGFEKLAIGMTIGESRTEKIPPELAFGAYRPDLSCQVSLKWLRAYQVRPDVGAELEVQQADGTAAHMIIADVVGERVRLDANHRLAGKTIILQLDLVDILDIPPEGEGVPRPNLET